MVTSGRWAEEDEEDTTIKPRATVGVAIAPPPSLQELSEPTLALPTKSQSTNSYGGSVAAKIMARYGFKEGQGLGRMEQGMSSALQVSISKRDRSQKTSVTFVIHTYSAKYQFNEVHFKLSKKNLRETDLLSKIVQINLVLVL